MKLGSLLALPAAAFQTTASVLKIAASIGERLAAVIKPEGDVSTPQTAPATGPAPAPIVPAAQAPNDAVAATPGPVDIAALASRTQPEIVAALDGLSALDLADLYDHESRHRRRPGVLSAVEAAAAPPIDVRTPDPLPLDEVRIPDELVYSTQTPRRR